MRGCRIIIPKSHQAEVLNQIHEGHLQALPNNLSQRTTLMSRDINTLLPMPIQDVASDVSSLISKTYPEKASSSTEASPDPNNDQKW
ncbi:hypothetical protein AVEN_94683-1 [Araneus ventricosus]|uniref:Uncharacterized protein n=1 Tax=Araneus ventricosus TaxID=182803 RepID=A0A4Y2I686_ARAVE|nr:hypothetical protein AVEN_94683-1 [Araneus ventricosus]